MTDTKYLYAITKIASLTPGDLVFLEDSERIVTSSKPSPASTRLATIQRHWPYLSVVHVFEPEDEIPAAACSTPPRFTPYSRTQGMHEAAAAQSAYEARTP